MAGEIGRAIGLQGRIPRDRQLEAEKRAAERQRIAEEAKAKAQRDKDFADISKDIVNNADLEPHWKSKAGSATAEAIDELMKIYEDPDRNIKVEGTEILRKWTEKQGQYKGESDAWRKAVERDPDLWHKNDRVLDIFADPERAGDDSKMMDDPIYGVSQYYDPSLPDPVGYSFNPKPRFDRDKWLTQNIKAPDFSETVDMDPEYLSEVDQWKYASYQRVPESNLDVKLGPIKQESGYITDSQIRFVNAQRATNPDYQLGDLTGDPKEDTKKAVEWAYQQDREDLAAQKRNQKEAIKSKKEEKYSGGGTSSRTPWGVISKYDENREGFGEPGTFGYTTGLTFSKRNNQPYRRDVEVRGGFYDKDKQEWVTTGEDGKIVPGEVHRLMFGIWDTDQTVPSWGLQIKTDWYYDAGSDSKNKKGYGGGKTSESGWKQKKGQLRQMIIPVSDATVRELSDETDDRVGNVSRYMAEQEDQWYAKRDSEPVKFLKSHIEASAKSNNRTYEQEVDALQKTWSKNGRTITIKDDSSSAANPPANPAAPKQKVVTKADVEAQAKKDGTTYDEYVKRATRYFKSQGIEFIVK